MGPLVGPAVGFAVGSTGFHGGHAQNLLGDDPASTSMRRTSHGVVATLVVHQGYGFIRSDDCSAPRPTSF